MILGRICRFCRQYHRGPDVCDAAKARHVDGPHIRTDDNNPLKNTGRDVGHPMETREDVKRAEREYGVVFASPKDFEVCQQRAHARRRNLLKDAIRRCRDELTIRV